MTREEQDSSAPKRHRMSSTKLFLGAVLWIGVFIGLFFVWQGRQDKAEAGRQEDSENTKTDADANYAQDANEDSGKAPTVTVKLPPRELPDFEFDEVMGGKYGLKDLKGKRWVASMVFSRCTQTCPTISAAMMRLHERVAESAPDVMFVTVTVDPGFDSLDVFRQYSEIYTKGDHSRWKFLTGRQQEVFELVLNGFGLYVKENDPKTRLPGIEVAHSNRVVLVNEDGIPVGTFLGTEEADMVRLRRILTGRTEFPTPSSGLTFRRPDGTVLPVELQAVPKTDEGEKDDTVDSENDAASGESDSDTDDEPQPTTTPNAKDDDATTTKTSLTPAQHNKKIDEAMPVWAKNLPSWNAGLNTLAAILLLTGFVAIKRKQKERHRNLMIAAFLTSVVFLISYLTYHYALGKYTGEHGKRFSGEGIFAVLYQLILWPHIILAAVVPVLAIVVFRHAFAERWDAHRKLAKITFPIWMFVSVTGVVIYGMLYHWPASDG